MNLFGHTKMKYRLILVILLPVIILMIFVGRFLWNDYETILKMNDIKSLNAVAGDIRSLISALKQEALFSYVKGMNKNYSFDKELSDARQTSDNDITALENMVGGLNIEFNGKLLKEYYRKIFEKLDGINQKREIVDANNLSKKETIDIYMGMINDLTESAANIARNSINLDISRNFFELLILIQQELTASHERRIILSALLQDKISSEEYNELLNLIGQQEAFGKDFFNLAPDEQDNLYRNTVKGQSVNEANRIRNEIISKGILGKFSIDPMAWLETKSSAINLIQDVEKKMLNENNQLADDIKSQRENIFILTLIAIAGSLTVSFVLLYFTLRSLTNNLQEELELLLGSSKEILTSITEASSGTAETASAVTETTTTMEELKQTAQVTADKASNVSDVSEEALKVLKGSEDSMELTITGMNKIQDGMGTISESIVKLSEQSQSIGKIIDSVNDLAEQSHLLAVNAAIEAAKAGEQGKGFAVVAQEVRSLAEQSKQATIQVRNILNDIQNSTSAAVMATEQGSKAVSQGVNQSQKTNESIRSISSGIGNVVQAAQHIKISSQQQLVGVGQVTIAMGNIKEASNLQVDHMRQIESKIHTMQSKGKLDSLIKEYKF